MKSSSWSLNKSLLIGWSSLHIGFLTTYSTYIWKTKIHINIGEALYYNISKKI